ncbi:MAG TPA: hypothetical protein VFM68_02915 [Candidatus Saccharimonadales bacterium]|nr:hypothetical protein [Candidatus Saccharimonadales bacterium]
MSLSLSYEFCDNPNDENAPRYEIKANNAEKYLAAADEVEQALQSDPKFDMPKRRLGDIDASIRHMSAVRILQDARHNSLKSSIADEFTQCEAPVEDETSWFRRKKCGADVVGRVLPRSEMVKRNEEAELMRKYGTTGFVAVSKLQKFKPIR